MLKSKPSDRRLSASHASMHARLASKAQQSVARLLLCYG
jgi:hypothetical protein